MLISIIIPAYNRKKELLSAMDAILLSDHPAGDIIIIDDFSDPPVNSYINEQDNIRIIRNTGNKGPAYSRNIGAEYARGDILFFLDSDVRVHKGTLSRLQLDFEDQSIDAVTGLYDISMPHRDFFSSFYNLRIIKGYLNSHTDTDLCLGAVFAIRKTVFEKLGGFSLKYRTASVEDVELGNRISSSGYRKIIDKDLSVIHDKKFNIISILKNDFNRAAQRVEFLFTKNGLSSLFKNRRFNHTSLGQVVSCLLAPVAPFLLFLSLQNKIYSIYFVAAIILMLLFNLGYIRFNFNIKGFLFAFKTALFLPLDMLTVSAGVLSGLFRFISIPLRRSWYLRYLYFLKYILLHNRPVEITYFVTDRCNAACTHCFYWDKINSGQDELSPEDAAVFFKPLKPLLRLLLSGGEPFLRKDLAALVKSIYIAARPLHITIPTNGIDTKHIIETTEDILDFCSDTTVNLSVSLDGIDQERDSITGIRGSFEKTISTFSRLKKLKERYPNLIVGTVLTCIKDNQKNLIQIYRFSKDILKADNISLALARGDAKDRSQLEVDIRNYIETADMIERDSYTARFPFWRPFVRLRNLTHKYVQKTFTEKRRLLQCQAGILRLVVSPAGDIYPCEIHMLKNREKFYMGNPIKEHKNIREVLAGQRAREISYMIKSSGCYCTHECDLTTSILFDIKKLAGL